MKPLKWVLIVFGVLVLVGVLVAAYFGLIPGLSKAMGPGIDDLGVKLSVEEAYAGAKAMSMPTQRTDLQAILKNPAAAKRFNATLTSDQASSLLLQGQTGIPNFPLYLVHIKFGSGGNAEASAGIRASSVKPFLSWLGVSGSDADTVVSKVRLLTDVPLKLKGTLSVKNNDITCSLSQIQIGRLTVPGSWYQGNEDVGMRYIEGALTKNGFMVESLEIDGSAVKLNGQRPLSSLEPWLKLVP